MQYSCCAFLCAKIPRFATWKVSYVRPTHIDDYYYNDDNNDDYDDYAARYICAIIGVSIELMVFF